MLTVYDGLTSERLTSASLGKRYAGLPWHILLLIPRAC